MAAPSSIADETGAELRLKLVHGVSPPSWPSYETPA